MPSSRATSVPYVVNAVKQLKPESVLDVGVGFGKYGHLFREYTDIVASEAEPARYEKSNWRCRVDGIEGHAAYLTPMHEYLYDTVHVGLAQDVLPTLEDRTYDLVWIGDVIEHFTPEDGRQVIAEAARVAKKAVLMATPSRFVAQEDACDNELERHRSCWTKQDFKQAAGHLGRVLVKDLPGRKRMAAVLVDPTVALRIAPQGRPWSQRLGLTKAA